MSNLRIIMASLMLFAVGVSLMAQFPADPQQKPVSATVPFPATWNAPPEYHDMVIAVRISGLSDKSYNSITVAIGKQYMFDEMKFRDAMQSNPIRPEPIKGFSNQYAPTENGGTAYLRMEFRCHSERDVTIYKKDYEDLIKRQMAKVSPLSKVEIEIVLSEALKKKIKGP